MDPSKGIRRVDTWRHWQKETCVDDDTCVDDTGVLAPEPGPLTELPRSLAEVATAYDGSTTEYELILAPGATAADITAAMILMPPAAALVQHRGDAMVSLVFEESARSPGGATVWATGGEPDTPDKRDDIGAGDGHGDVGDVDLGDPGDIRDAGHDGDGHLQDAYQARQPGP